MQEICTQAAALSREIALLIKLNPRSTPVEAIAAERVADTNTMWCHQREGKRMCMWTQELSLEGVGTQANPARRVFRLIERTIVDLGFCHKHGNALLGNEVAFMATFPAGWPGLVLLTMFIGPVSSTRFLQMLKSLPGGF